LDPYFQPAADKYLWKWVLRLGWTPRLDLFRQVAKFFGIENRAEEVFEQEKRLNVVLPRGGAYRKK
jgi:hypothetical protein